MIDKRTGTEDIVEWSAEDVKPEHADFIDKMFTDNIVMANFEGGKPKPTGYGTKKATDWIERFSKGQPTGAIVFSTKLDGEPKLIGWGIVRATQRPGTAEIGGAIIPELWSKGLGGLGVKELLNRVTPEIRRIGLIGKAGFLCFHDTPLKCIEATASPENPGSWKILDKMGFGAAIFNVESEVPVADYSGREDLKDLSGINAEILKLFDPTTTDKPLIKGNRYRISDPQGIIRTISWHLMYDVIKTHFEYNVS